MSLHDSNNNSGLETIRFNAPAEEIAYLKNKLEEAQTEFLEFQESSRELEAEYETHSKQLEKKNNDYLNQINRLEAENEQYRSRYTIYVNDTQHKLNEYQQQLAELTALNDRLTSYIRELEQNNDDLERAQRALAASLEDFEGQLNQQIERNVLLENEVSEKEELECVVQRLKEEARDLRHELIANKNSNDSARRKQLIMDSQLTALQNDSLSSMSLKSEKSPDKVSKLDSPPAAQSENHNSNLMIETSNKRPLMVDSATSPPQTPSRFSFPSPLSLQSPNSPKYSEKPQLPSNKESAPEIAETSPSIVMTPSSRITALNIVTDLLRRVGALESRIATAKKVAN